MQYEYMTTGFLGWTEKEIMLNLNAFGSLGWEIVSSGPRPRTGGWLAHHSWLLKRAI